MSFPRKIFEFMQAATIAHAKRELEVSTNILRSKKRRLILVLIKGPN